MNQSDRGFPEIVEQLHAHRAELSPLDLDRIKRTSRARAAGKPQLRITREGRIVMRTRGSILAMLVAGIALSGGGAAMGVSGLASSGSASHAQYQPWNGKGGTEVLGAHAVKGTARGSHGVRGAHAGAPRSAAAVAQPTRQVSLNRGGSLPFTGYAAIPVLLLGLGLLGTGVVMRRRARLGDES